MFRGIEINVSDKELYLVSLAAVHLHATAATAHALVETALGRTSLETVHIEPCKFDLRL